MKVFKSIQNTERKAKEAYDSLSAKGNNFYNISANTISTLFEDGAGEIKVKPERKVKLNPDLNRPYRELLRALEGGEGLTASIYASIGLVTLMILHPDRIGLQVRPFPKHDMTEAIVEQLQRDLGKKDGYCGLFYNDGAREHLLGLYYPANGLLVASIGITEGVVRSLNVPFLTWTNGEAVWHDPLAHAGAALSGDCAQRTLFMVERMYPAQTFPGIIPFLNLHNSLLTTNIRSRLTSLVRPEYNPELESFIGRENYERLTVPGYGDAGKLPAFFMDTLPFMQLGEGELTEGARPGQKGEGDKIIGSLLRQLELDGKTVTMIPPVTAKLLDTEGVKVIDAAYSLLGSGVNTAIKADLTVIYNGEQITRTQVYAIKDLIDISGAPNVLQYMHMKHIDDEIWKGRYLIATGFAKQSVRNNEPVFGIEPIVFGNPETAVLPNGKETSVYSISSGATGIGWALYKTGVQTRYITLQDAYGTPAANILTTSPAGDWEKQSYSGIGLISGDMGHTTAKIVLNYDASAREPEMIPLKVNAEEITQVITPMRKTGFDEICSVILMPSLTGEIHPTAIERFVAPTGKGSLEFPGAELRILNFSSEQLAQLASDKKKAAHYYFNVKNKSAGTNSDEVEMAERAFGMAIGTYVQLAYLQMLSHGQSNVKVLLSYPRGLKSREVYEAAVEMINASIKSRKIDYDMMPEAFAAVEYVKATEPGGLAGHNRMTVLLIDIGGMSSDIDASKRGKSVASTSVPVAGNLIQQTALLALLRKAHTGAARNWDDKNGMAILKSVFPDLPEMGKDKELRVLADNLMAKIDGEMRGGNPSAQLKLVYDEVNKKILEQMFRKGEWLFGTKDRFTRHWMQLWALPIVDVIADNLKVLQGEDVVMAFTGAGSIYFDGLLRSDPGFRKKVMDYLSAASGVTNLRMECIGSPQKPEIAEGMMYAVLNESSDKAKPAEDEKAIMARMLGEIEARIGDDEDLREDYDILRKRHSLKLSDVRRFSAEVIGEKITREKYDAFVEGLRAYKLIEDESHAEHAYGLESVYDLLVYSADTMGGFDSFRSLVANTLEMFPMIIDQGEGSERLLMYMLALNIANRNLLNRQCGYIH